MTVQVLEHGGLRRLLRDDDGPSQWPKLLVLQLSAAMCISGD